MFGGGQIYLFKSLCRSAVIDALSTQVSKVQLSGLDALAFDIFNHSTASHLSARPIRPKTSGDVGYWWHNGEDICLGEFSIVISAFSQCETIVPGMIIDTSIAIQRYVLPEFRIYSFP